MTPALSKNTQAILLLTAPLIAGKSASSPELLSPGEYKRLARLLREMQRQPADLLSPDAADVITACRPVIEEGRLKRLLGRGFLLSQAIDRWQSRAIWVISRADADYPRRLKARLSEDAPAVFYGCGDLSLMETGGLAVVGSRDVDELLFDYTMSIGRLCAKAGKTLVSGGARGIDQAAMRGALEAGGKVSGILADSLERTAMNREHRNQLIDGQLVLISPYDPNAGFNVGNAMQRNKLIYAFAEVSLVVSSDIDKGGTWTGATEQLDKLRLVPVYVRSTGANSEGLDALRKKGAIAWPNPQDADDLTTLFDVAASTTPSRPRDDLTLFMKDAVATAIHNAALPEMPDIQTLPDIAKEPLPPFDAMAGSQTVTQTAADAPQATKETERERDSGAEVGLAKVSPADVLFAVVREEIQRLLIRPMKETEIAAALGVSTAQAKTWLQRVVDEGIVERNKKPSGYILKRSRLF